MQRRQYPLCNRLDAVASAQRNPTARLEAVALGYVSFWLAHREHYFLVFMSGGISRAEVEGYVATGAPGARFDLFVRCLDDALGKTADAKTLQVKSEALLCALNGISQALKTISGRDWSSPEALVRTVVNGVLKA